MNIPDPDDALKAIAPVIPAVYGALEAGVQGAREFFDSKGTPIDPYHAASCVRWEAGRYLDTHGHQIGDADYDRDTLANNGLRLSFGKYAIWILKSADGGLPVPGPSQIKQRFYSQQLSFDFMGGNDTDSSAVGLVVLWDVTEHYRLRELRLVCPEAGQTTRESVKAYWNVAIPHPALAVEGPTTPGEVDDLDISLDEPEADTGSTPA